MIVLVRIKAAETGAGGITMHNATWIQGRMSKHGIASAQPGQVIQTKAGCSFLHKEIQVVHTWPL